VSPDLRTQPGPHVFVADLTVPELHDDDYHHLTKSLRLRAGDPLTLSDGAGSWCTAAFASCPEPTSEVHQIEPYPYEIGVGIALTKASKPEFVVQKATELGLDSVVIFEAERSVARWDEAKRAKNQQRLDRVAREAAMQSHRVTVPTVSIATDMPTAVGGVQTARADFGGTPLTAEHRVLLIGPEGGWSDAEIDHVQASVDLGPTVLRAETAAIVAAAFLSKFRYEMG